MDGVLPPRRAMPYIDDGVDFIVLCGEEFRKSSS
jgi:hypothetical protein